ncbi:MAG: magnesium transporter [Clostridia bacterium]|nr:magnesium transporter [Clostridia bacterium]
MELEKENAQAMLPDYKKEIAELVGSDLAPKPLRDRLSEYHENDIASAMELLTGNERRKLYRMIDDDTLSGVIEYTAEKSLYLNELELKRRLAVLTRMEVGDAVEYLRSLEKKERNALIGLLPAETRNEIMLLSSFDEDEIGSKMSTNYISVLSGVGVRAAMRELVSQAADNDNVSTIYVVDQDGTFVGAITLKDLIVARADTPLDSIVMSSYPYVYASEQIDTCLERIRGYSEDSIPVLDADNKLRGVLTAQELAEMIEDEIGDDYAKLAGLSAEEELHEPLIKSIGKRLPWLAVLFALGLVVSWVVGLFESVADEIPVIVSFQSLILGMAGNVGTQSLAVTIRLLMDERLTGRQKSFLIFKEARVGLFNGFILGILSFGLIGLYLFLLRGDMAFAFSVSMCTGVSLAVAMLLSGVFGAAIPIGLKKLGVDPAVASGPFITTVNDLVAVVTYYGLALALLLNF